MQTPRFLFSATALGLIAALTVPPSASALRPVSAGLEGSPVREELTERLLPAGRKADGTTEELSKLDDRELIRRFQQEKDERALEALLERHGGLIHHAIHWVVAKRGGRLVAGVTYDDLESWARAAFADGIRDFDLAKPFKLSDYMVPYLKKIRQEFFRSHPIRLWQEANSRPWLLAAYRHAESELDQEGKPGTFEEFRSKMLDWVTARGGHPERLTYLTEEFTPKRFRGLALTYKLLGRRFLRDGKEDETGRRQSVSELAGLKRASLDDASNVVLEREFLERLIEQLSPEQGEALRLYVELEPDEAKKGESEEIIGRIAQELGKEPQQALALVEAAQRRARAAVGRWLREGKLSEKEIRSGEVRSFFLVEDQIAALAEAAGGVLGPDFLRGRKDFGMAAKDGQALAVAYLNELREGDSRDQAHFDEYMRRLTPPSRKTIEWLLANPEGTQKELAEQMGMVRHAVWSRLDRAFQTLALLATVRREGPDSFEALIWRLSAQVKRDWRTVVRALHQAGIRDRESLLALRADALPPYLRRAHFRKALLEFLAEERGEPVPGQMPSRQLQPPVELPEAGPVEQDRLGADELTAGDRSV